MAITRLDLPNSGYLFDDRKEDVCISLLFLQPRCDSGEDNRGEERLFRIRELE